MHVREQRRLLYRFIFSVAMTIPTFIIAVVYMSLVKDGNPTKTFLMEPMWTGNTSRAVWALFFLATPVMFYSANLFHQRSIKEIRVLWRRGSTTPILKRFIRFGSMNLLVCSPPIPYSIHQHTLNIQVSSGVSVAYFSSIALLVLAAVQRPSQERVGDTTTYFDAVVFLTMFLLAGMCSLNASNQALIYR
jgi:cation transport ATPase